MAAGDKGLHATLAGQSDVLGPCERTADGPQRCARCGVECKGRWPRGLRGWKTAGCCPTVIDGFAGTAGGVLAGWIGLPHMALDTMCDCCRRYAVLPGICVPQLLLAERGMTHPLVFGRQRPLPSAARRASDTFGPLPVALRARSCVLPGRRLRKGRDVTHIHDGREACSPTKDALLKHQHPQSLAPRAQEDAMRVRRLCGGRTAAKQG